MTSELLAHKGTPATVATLHRGESLQARSFGSLGISGWDEFVGNLVSLDWEEAGRRNAFQGSMHPYGSFPK